MKIMPIMSTKMPIQNKVKTEILKTFFISSPNSIICLIAIH